jgi:hypothetical protein
MTYRGMFTDAPGRDLVRARIQVSGKRVVLGDWPTRPRVSPRQPTR